MACRCTYGKSPDHIARGAILEEIAIDLYRELAAPDWTSNECTTDELVDAVDAMQQHYGNHPSGDYSQAVDWCAHMVSERELAVGDIDGLSRREDQSVRATLRGIG